LAQSFPQAEQAKGYLEGYLAGQHHSIDAGPAGLDDDVDA